MTPASAGRNTICGRFTRHLNVICIDAFDDTTLDKIFGSIVTWRFSTLEDTAIQRLDRVSIRMMLTIMGRFSGITSWQKLDGTESMYLNIICSSTVWRIRLATSG